LGIIRAMNKWLPVLALIGLACLGVGVYSLFKKPPQTPVPPPKEEHIIKQFVVPGNVMWADTGIDVTGKILTIRYVAGTWSNGGPPELMLWSDAGGGGGWSNLIVPGVPIRALVGKTDEGAFYVGKFHEIRGQHGHLRLSMNDTDEFNDNKGSVTVTISE